MVNMLILTLVLFSTLTGIYFLMYNSEIHISEEIMDTLIENHKKNPPAKGDPHFEKRPDDIDDFRLMSGEGIIQQNLLIRNNSGIMRLADGNGDHVWGGDPYWNGNPYVSSWNDDNHSFPEHQSPDTQYPQQNNSQWNYWNPWNPWNYWNPWNPGNQWNNGNQWNGSQWNGDGQWNGNGNWNGDWNNNDNFNWDEYWKNYWENSVQGTTSAENSSEPVVSETSAEENISIPEINDDPEAVIPSEEPVFDQTEPEHEEMPSTQPPEIQTEPEPVPVHPSEETTSAVTSAVPDISDNRPAPEKQEITTRYDGNLVRSHIYAQLGADKEILNISYQYFFQYDEKETEAEFDPKIRTVLNTIATGSDMTGKYDIDSVSYRYKLSKDPGESKYSVILLDRSIEISTLNRLLLTFIIIGCVGVIVVFIISLVLANWAIKPIEVAWNRQKQFIADASHELKTPLTVIATNTDVVLANPNDSIRDQERWLKYIKSETSRMSKLVSELLYIAKSDSNEIRMEMSEFDLSNVMSSVCLTFEPIIFEAGRELVSDITPKLRYYGDEDRIRQLITILLDNASKYSLVGSTISVSLFRNTQNKIKFCVSNKCESMTEENVSKLFDRFYRVDSSRNSGTGGNGLGLNIAQTIAEAHNGNIQVIYNYGMISFTVTL